MRILLINPNSDLEMTEKIKKNAELFAKGEYEVECMHSQNAPPFIETYGDIVKAAPDMERILKENQDFYDGFVIACGYDPNLDMMKEISEKPLVGMAEASLKIASMLGDRFTVLSTDAHSIPIKRELIEKYQLERSLASIRVVEVKENLIDAYIETARQAVKEDGAEVIVLSCAGFSGINGRISREIGVPVLDGIQCALMIVSGLIRCKMSISKVRKYSLYYEERKSLQSEEAPHGKQRTLD